MIRRIKEILNEVYLTTLSVDDILSGDDVDIFINPSVSELKSIIDNTGKKPNFSSMKGVRFIIDDSGKSFVWGWDEAIHSSIWNKLKLNSNVVGGIATVISTSGERHKEVAFDLGNRSLNKRNEYNRSGMEDLFFKSSLAKNLGMNIDNTKVKFFEYEI